MLQNVQYISVKRKGLEPKYNGCGKVNGEAKSFMGGAGAVSLACKLPLWSRRFAPGLGGAGLDVVALPAATFSLCSDMDISLQNLAVLALSQAVESVLQVFSLCLLGRSSVSRAG